MAKNKKKNATRVGGDGDDAVRDLLPQEVKALMDHVAEETAAAGAGATKRQKERLVENAVQARHEARERRAPSTPEGDEEKKGIRTRRESAGELRVRLDPVDARLVKRLKRHFAMPGAMVARVLIRNEIARIDGDDGPPFSGGDDGGGTVR